MEKSITFKLNQNDYSKCLLSKILNMKIFFLLYIIFFVTQVKEVVKNFSISYLIAQLLMTFLITTLLFILYYGFMKIYSIYIYNRDKILTSEVTINFREQVLEEITQYSTYTIKYKEIYRLKLLKSMILIYLSPARIIIIPKNPNYDIKELYSLIKNLKENK